MPNYRNKWVALLYLLWYQPAQINLAYTLAQRVPEHSNPLLARAPSLSVLDFGCGSLAMQFGLALAVIDKYRKFGSDSRITLYQHDESNEMKDIGSKVWEQFMHEICKTNECIYALLKNSFRLVNLGSDGLLSMDLIDAHDLPWNFEFRAHDRPWDIELGDGDSAHIRKHIRWLSSLHVAYSGNYSRIKRSLDDCIFYYTPDIVLTTSHPNATLYRFVPKSMYKCYPHYISGPLPENQRFGYRHCYGSDSLQHDLTLEGGTNEINRIRTSIYNRMHDTSVGDDSVVIELLRSVVSWRGKASLAADIYTNNDAGR